MYIKRKKASPNDTTYTKLKAINWMSYAKINTCRNRVHIKKGSIIFSIMNPTCEEEKGKFRKD